MTIYCKSCKQNQILDSPVIMKLPNNKYVLNGICAICKNSISKNLSKTQIKLLPQSIKDANSYTVHKEFNDDKSGGLLPLATLVPIILGAIGAVSTAAKNLVIDPILENKKIETQKELIKGSGLNEAASPSRTLDDIVKNVESLSDHEKRQLITAFRGMGYAFI